MHEIADAAEALADAASGVEVGEVFGLPIFAPAEFEGEGVAEGEHDGGGGGGGEVERAGFGVDADVEEDVGGLSESAGGVAAEGDEGSGKALEGGEDAEEFFGLATVGEGEDGVAGGDEADVAVDGFGGVEEVGGGSGGA